MFVQTKSTPNPNAMKFLLDQDIKLNDSIHFNNLKEAENKSTLVCKLFAIGNIEFIYLNENFITITKNSYVTWENIIPQLSLTIIEHFKSGGTLIDQGYNNTKVKSKTTNPIEEEIIEVIETKIRPAVARDGGDIVYKSFKRGVVSIQMRGACSQCPSATITLKNGIEAMLKHYVPEVKSVESEN